MQLTYCDSRPPPLRVAHVACTFGRTGALTAVARPLPASSAPCVARPIKHKWNACAPPARGATPSRHLVGGGVGACPGTSARRRWPSVRGARPAGSARALPQEDGGPKPAGEAAASARVCVLGRTWVCQSRNHCTKSDATGDLERVTTDNSVCAKWAFCSCRQFYENQVHVHCRDSRKDANLPQCCFVLCRFPVPADCPPYLACRLPLRCWG